MKSLREIQTAVSAVEDDLKALRDTVPAEVAELINGRALPEAAGLLQTLYRIGSALDRMRP